MEHIQNILDNEKGKNAAFLRLLGLYGMIWELPVGGAGGIRTLDTLLTYTHFPGVRLRPLGHRSAARLRNGASLRACVTGKGGSLAVTRADDKHHLHP